MTPPAHATEPQRRRDVDLTRTLLVFGLILFHSARIFDLLPFYVKNEDQSLALMAFVGFVSQWGMPLFFLVAGFASWHSLKTRTAGQYALERFKRLVVPLVFGIVVLVPPQHYYNLRTNPNYHESYWSFYPRFFHVVLTFDFPEFVRADPAVEIFGPAHLWFLYYLFVFSMILLPLFVYLRRPRGVELIARLARFCQKPGRILVLALPVIVIETLILTKESTGWNRYAYIAFLINGYLFAADKRLEQSLYKHGNIGLAGAILTLLLFFWASVVNWQAGTDPTHGFAWNGVWWRLSKSCTSFLWIVAILGLAQRFRRRGAPIERDPTTSAVDATDEEAGHPSIAVKRLRDSLVARRIREYANEATLPFYIIHQTLIVVIGFYVVQLNAGVMPKYLLVVTPTIAGTLLLYEVAVRRTTLTRVLFGMKPRKKQL